VHVLGEAKCWGKNVAGGVQGEECMVFVGGGGGGGETGGRGIDRGGRTAGGGGRRRRACGRRGRKREKEMWEIAEISFNKKRDV
jgi:hypothetical protein